MLRTLIHYGRLSAAVAAGAAVATAVLSGALLVGDSVRGSLRELTLDRLGRIDQALVAERFFREALAGELAAAGLPGVVPAIVLRGAASRPATGSRAARVAVLGVDERFSALYGPKPAFDLSARTGGLFPPAVLNRALARELGVAPGDDVLLHFGRSSDVPRESLMGRTDSEHVLGRLRVTVAEVIPDRGPGRFGLGPTQETPLNAFVARPALQRALGERGRINALLLPGGFGGQAAPILRRAATLEDLGLTLERGAGFVTVGSREFVLRPQVDQAIEAVAARIGAPLLRTQSYLANTIRLGERVVPYSLVAALDPLPALSWGRLTLADGRPAQDLGLREIWLNAWAAQDLRAVVGDRVELRYFEVGADERLTEKEVALQVAGIVALEGLGADATLTPRYPGIEQARDIAAWDPPFPVDLAQIREQDERYWDAFGALPKAFVAARTGRELWSTRFGSTTAARIGLPTHVTAEQLEQELRDGLSAAASDLVFRPVREEGLRAARGATDFSALFVSFSSFIIVSAALLVGLLFRLGVERRAAEIGLLLAIGYRVRAVRRRLLVEGLLLATAGGLIGLAGGVGYAWAMMAGLRTLWRPAVGTSELYLHVAPATLPLGGAISVGVVLGSIALAVRRLVRETPQRLLAGEATLAAGPAQPGRLVSLVAYGGALVGCVLLAVAAWSGQAGGPAAAFGSGAALLAAGLAFFARWLRGSRRSKLEARAGLARMAARNSAWNPGRSVLSVGLVASACFVLVLVAAAGGGHDERGRESGTGGYALLARSDVPLHQDLSARSELLELGFAAREADDVLAQASITALRALPGDDASCLNLYRPERPRIVGASEAFIERGGFVFEGHLALPAGEANPWRLLARPLEPGVVPAVADFNSATWILHRSLGDDLVIEDEHGEPLRLRLVGLVARSVIQSEVLISEAAFVEHFPSRTGKSFFLIDAPPQQAARVAGLLEAKLAPFGFDATAAEERLAGFRSVENTYIATFQLLGALGLLLGTAGLGVVLLRNVVERRGELAALRAFGFRRARLAWLVVIENAFLLCVGAAIGTLAALAAAAPRLSLEALPWAPLGWTLAGVGVAGMASSVLAVRGALDAPLVPALRSER